jgi:hypothetical protein
MAINLLAVLLAPMVAQSSAAAPPVACGAAATSAAACTIRMDRDAPLAGRHATVRNGSTVRFLLVHKSPFEICSLESKREEILQPSVIPELLKLLAGVAPSLDIFRTTEEAVTRFLPPPPRAAAPPSTIPQQITALLDNAMSTAAEQSRMAAALQQEYVRTLADVSRFFGTPFRQSAGPGDRPVHDEAEFGELRTRIVAAIGSAKNRPLPTVAGSEASYAAALALFRRYETGSNPESQLASLTQAIDLARSAIDALGEAVAKLKDARAGLTGIEGDLDDLADPSWTFARTLTADQNARVTGVVSCADARTKKTTLEPVAWTVTFQNAPRLTLSAGVMVSSLPKEHADIVEIASTRSGTAVGSIDEVQQTSSRPQLVPMSYLHVRLGSIATSHRLIAFGLAEGLGLNLSNKEPEFFSGLSVSFGSFYVSGGFHIGHRERPGGGFTVGDRPSSSVTLPVDRPWTARPAVVFSYRIPM